MDPRVNRPKISVVGRERNEVDGREISIRLCLDGTGYWTVETWATGKFGTDREFGQRWSMHSSKENIEELARYEANRRWVWLREMHGPTVDPQEPWEEKKAKAVAVMAAWEEKNPRP